MIEIIDKLPNWLLVCLFVLLTIIILFVIVVLLIAIFGGREIKIGPVTIGKKESNSATKSVSKDEIKIDGNKTTWITLEKEILKTKDRLISDQFVPTLIVGIGRGGAVVSALLSGCLGNIPIIVIDRVYIWDKEGRKDEMLIKEFDLTKYKDKVLLVAGELHTGNTAKMYMEYFKAIECNSVKFYAFFKEKFPAFQPDYFSIENDKADIQLPWMITDYYKRQSLTNDNTIC